MATNDKVQKLSGEAFSRLKSDHEQFLEAYESEYNFTEACREDSWVSFVFIIIWYYLMS